MRSWLLSLLGELVTFSETIFLISWSSMYVRGRVIDRARKVLNIVVSDESDRIENEPLPCYV